jgi:hypothetical protein
MKNHLGSFLRDIVPPLLLLSAGFIFCMHWFLLMADTKVAGITTDIVPASIISTIIAYYSVIFGPMTWLVKVVILSLFVTIIVQLFIREIPWYLSWAIAITNLPLIILGVFKIIPLVDHFILNTDSIEVQSQIVRTVHDAHVLSAYGTAFMILLQLIVIIRMQRQRNAQ